MNILSFILVSNFCLHKHNPCGGEDVLICCWFKMVLMKSIGPSKSIPSETNLNQVETTWNQLKSVLICISISLESFSGAEVSFLPVILSQTHSTMSWGQNEMLCDVNEILFSLTGGCVFACVCEDAFFVSFTHTWVSIFYTLIVAGDERNRHTGEMAVQAEDRSQIQKRWDDFPSISHHTVKSIFRQTFYVVCLCQDPHVKVEGKRANVLEAKLKILELLKTKVRVYYLFCWVFVSGGLISAHMSTGE